MISKHHTLPLVYTMLVRNESHGFSYALHHNDTKNMTPTPLLSAVCVISRFLTKSTVFQKIFSWLQDKERQITSLKNCLIYI